METLILAINGGSSSLKYGAFTVGEDRVETVVSGAVGAAPDHTAVFDEIAAKLDRPPHRPWRAKAVPADADR
jgi:acetate kinase